MHVTGGATRYLAACLATVLAMLVALTGCSADGVSEQDALDAADRATTEVISAVEDELGPQFSVSADVLGAEIDESGDASEGLPVLAEYRLVIVPEGADSDTLRVDVRVATAPREGRLYSLGYWPVDQLISSTDSLRTMCALPLDRRLGIVRYLSHKIGLLSSETYFLMTPLSVGTSDPETNDAFESRLLTVAESKSISPDDCLWVTWVEDGSDQGVLIAFSEDSKEWSEIATVEADSQGEPIIEIR